MSEPIFDIRSCDPRTRAVRAQLHSSAQAEPKPWRWPLARVGSRDPIILAEHVGDERSGVDLGFIRKPYDSELFIPVRAVQAGEVAFATQGIDGCMVTIDHGGIASHYGHLSKMFVTPRLRRSRRCQYVKAGEEIGYAAKSPIYVRFELWQWTDDRGFVSTDPWPYLDQWKAPAPDLSARAEAAMTNPANEAA